MDYRVFKPSGQLSELVQCFWTLESGPSQPTPKDYFLMADSCPEIIFQYNEGFQAYSAQSARVRFQHSISSKFNVGEKVGFFGIRLNAHAASQLLNMPADELVNQVFDFSEFFKQDGADLADQVYNASNNTERIALVSAFLVKKASGKTDPIKHLVDKLVISGGTIDISKVQQASGLSVKQFERRFKAITGFPPKYFARLVRFQAAKEFYPHSRFSSMTSLAYASNYYDQSHFNREFKEFSGVQPLQYFKRLNPDNTGSVKVDDGKQGGMPQPIFDGYLPCGWFV